MTAYTGGIGGLPPAPPFDCDGTPPPPVPSFIVSYDQGTDTVTVESSVPFFGPDVQAIQIHLDGGAGNWLLTDGAQFNTVDSTHITFANATAYGSVLESIDFWNDGSTTILRGQWTGNVPFGAPATPDVTDAKQSSPTVYSLYGTGLDTAGLRWRVIDDFTFDTYYYDSLGPDAGLNPPGVTVAVSAGQVDIDDPNLVPAGIAPTLVQTRDSGNVVVDEFYPLTWPILLAVCSPAPDTIRFTGLRFLTATAGAIGYVITRLADYSNGPPVNVLEGPGMQYELADGSPDANGWSLITHTDDTIEISNPAFSTLEPDGGPGDFVVTGAAFHDPTATTMYYWEPWGLTFNTPVDGAGC